MNTEHRTATCSEAYICQSDFEILFLFYPSSFSIRILNTTVSEPFSLLNCLLSVVYCHYECRMVDAYLPFIGFVQNVLFACSLYGCSFLLYVDPESRLSCLSWLLLLCGSWIIILFILLIIFSCKIVHRTISCLFDEVLFVCWLVMGFWNGFYFIFFIFYFYFSSNKKWENFHERTKYDIHCGSFVEWSFVFVKCLSHMLIAGTLGHLYIVHITYIY